MVNDDIKEYVREFFGIGIQKVPEIILIGLAQINVTMLLFFFFFFFFFFLFFFFL